MNSMFPQLYVFLEFTLQDCLQNGSPLILKERIHERYHKTDQHGFDVSSWHSYSFQSWKLYFSTRDFGILFLVYLTDLIPITSLIFFKRPGSSFLLKIQNNCFFLSSTSCWDYMLQFWHKLLSCSDLWTNSFLQFPYSHYLMAVSHNFSLFLYLDKLLKWFHSSISCCL